MIVSNLRFLLVSASLVLALVAAPFAQATERTILVYGDSISAAYGMAAEQGWVSLLADRLAETRDDITVVNASVSGATTGGGVVRLPKTLEVHQPSLVILELGGNDGLRGYPIQKIRENTAMMTEAILASGADVVLVGMVLPPNYGRR